MPTAVHCWSDMWSHVVRGHITHNMFVIMHVFSSIISDGSLSLQCQLQLCSIDFVKAGFQLTVEKQLAITKSGEGNVCSKKERQFGQGLYISVLIL